MGQLDDRAVGQNGLLGQLFLLGVVELIVLVVGIHVRVLGVAFALVGHGVRAWTAMRGEGRVREEGRVEDIVET